VLPRRIQFVYSFPADAVHLDVTHLLATAPFDGRVAIVTGAARGIGLATARRLADAGARVLLADVDASALDDAAHALPGETATLAADLTAPGAPDELVAAAVSRWGGIDIVVNNAGFNWNAPAAEMTDEQFATMLDVNLVAPFRVLRSAAPHLLAARPDGAPLRKVVNMSSVSGTMGNPNQANYAAAKAGIIGMTKALAKEWGPHGVTVNALAPGFIETRLTAPRESAGAIELGDRTIELGVTGDRRSELTSLIALGRAGTADDVARVVCFLCSPDSDYVTGQVIDVNGGLMFGMTS
jgi:3-oxoacyl-[acyl-carrier protein] reductase